MLIYKITNLINQKAYIGQTIKDGQTRWLEHQKHSNGTHINDQNKSLYRAMRKYGIENFSFEILQDNIESYEDLDKAEIYWIDFFNTFVDGYNETSGGQIFHHYLPNKSIINDYLKTKSARKTAKNFGIDHSTVDDILNYCNIERFSFREAAGKRIIVTKDSFIKEFNSVKDCAEWFVEQKIPRTSSVESVRTSLKAARKNKTPYYGYTIENYEDKI